MTDRISGNPHVRSADHRPGVDAAVPDGRGLPAQSAPSPAPAPAPAGATEEARPSPERRPPAGWSPTAWKAQGLHR